MSQWFPILAFGTWLIAFWPCMSQEGPHVYEMGRTAQQLSVRELGYFMEPSSVPLDLEKFKNLKAWKMAPEGTHFQAKEVRGQRVVMYFDIRTAVETLYFNYTWSSPLDFQKFVVMDKDQNYIHAEVIRRATPLASVNLPKGEYRVFFIAEPTVLSDLKMILYVMNSSFMSGPYLKQSKFYLFVYGVGSAFIFFNFTMFLLHRRLYFIYYVGYSITILYLLAVGSGDIPQVSAVFWNLCLILNCLITILMSSSVLRLKENHPLLLRLAFILWAFSATLMTMRYLTDARIFLLVGIGIGLVCYLICIYTAVRRMQAGYIPATFFALGWAVIALGYGLSVVAVYFVPIPNLIFASYAAYAVESMLFAVALAYRTRDSEQRAIQDKIHALSQLQKVVYPHQMEQIRSGCELENTMPTTSGHACVLSFDIIGSSRIKHIRAKEFFRNVFARCNLIMSEGYDGKALKSNAYRVKEMGDGFLCSVGYPFQSMTVNPANECVDLAKRFAQILAEEAAILHAETPVACGIGIALDTLTGFYPEAGTKEYDIHGPALILATRYESMRKTLFEGEKGRSVLIIQDVVFQSLDPSHRAGFTAMDLKERGLVVRDDPAATALYYQFLNASAASPDHDIMNCA